MLRIERMRGGGGGGSTAVDMVEHDELERNELAMAAAAEQLCKHMGRAVDATEPPFSLCYGQGTE